MTVGGCKGDPSPGATTSAAGSASASVAVSGPGSAVPSANGSATGLASASAASSAPSAASAVAAGRCDLRWGFHGKVAGQDAYLRLARDGEGVSGRYFYARHGVDLALRGTLSPALALELTEGDAKAEAGHFKGTCDPRTGALTGTWSNGKKDEPFSFEPVAARDKPLVAAKRLKITRKAKAKTKGAGFDTCEYDQTRFELFGAGTPEIEAVLNEQDARTLTPKVLSKEIYDQVDKCEEGIAASYSAGVVATFHGLVTIESSGTYMASGAAHPANAVDFSRVTYDLTTGRPVTEKDLFAALPKDLIARCAKAFAKASEVEEAEAQITGREFDVRANGVHFFGNGYPHVLAALTGAGPTVTWEALLREGALRADSPVKRAWEGKAKAGAAGEGDCVLEEKLK